MRFSVFRAFIIITAITLAARAAYAVPVEIVVLDQFSRSHPAPITVRDLAGQPVKMVAASEPLDLDAGKWIVEPSFDPGLATQIDVAQGTPLRVEVRDDQAVWLMLKGYDGKPYGWFLLPLKDQAELQSAMQRLFLNLRFELEYLGARRLDVDENARNAALTLARQELLRTEPAADAKAQKAANAARRWAYRIIAAWGGDEDAARLAVPKSAWMDYAVAARIEERLGTIRNGRLVALLDQPDRDMAASAALNLWQAGVASGDAWLRRNVVAAEAEDTSSFLSWSSIWAAVVRLPPEEARPAVVLQLARYQRRQAEIEALPEDQRASAYNQYRATTLALLFFFLAHGGEELKPVIDIPIYYSDVSTLAFLTRDAPRLVPFFVETNEDIANATRWSAQMAAGALLLPVDQREAYVGGLASIVYSTAYPILIVRPDLIRPIAEAQANFYGAFLTEIASFAWPSESMAKYFTKSDDGKLPHASWAPEPWKTEEYLDLLLSGEHFENELLDNVLAAEQPARVAEVLKSRGDKAQAYPFGIFAAYHQVVDRANFAFQPAADEAQLAAMVSSEIDTRPYVFGRPEDPPDSSYEGGIAGLISLTPELSDRTLKLRIGLEQAPYYGYEGGFLELREGDRTKWAVHRYVLDRGRPLLSAVRLLGNDGEITVTEVKADPEGDFIFEASLPGTDLTGLTAVVELKFFDQTRRISFDLFAGDYAARLRRGAGGP